MLRTLTAQQYKDKKPNYRMGKRFEYTFFHKGYTNDQ